MPVPGCGDRDEPLDVVRMGIFLVLQNKRPGYQSPHAMGYYVQCVKSVTVMKDFDDAVQRALQRRPPDSRCDNRKGDQVPASGSMVIVAASPAKVKVFTSLAVRPALAVLTLASARVSTHFSVAEVASAS